VTQQGARRVLSTAESRLHDVAFRVGRPTPLFAGPTVNSRSARLFSSHAAGSRS
jgi:hypothetical protein